MTAAGGQDTARVRPRPRLLSGDRDFRLLWSASAVSQLGTQVSELAIPLAAIIALHAGPAEVGALAALGYLPAAMFGLYAGASADRLPRRRIMITADIARFAVLATVPVAYLLGVLAIGQLYAVTFCVGALSVFFDTASPAYLPALVARADLARANGRLQLSEQGAAVLGPGVAGWLIGLAGAPLAVAADAASYLASAIFLGRIGHREPSRPPQADAKSRIHAQIRDGIREVAASRQLRATAIAAAVINLFGRMMVILVPLYLIRDARYPPSPSAWCSPWVPSASWPAPPSPARSRSGSAWRVAWVRSRLRWCSRPGSRPVTWRGCRSWWSGGCRTGTRGRCWIRR